MLSSVLVANRGEIACRVMRTARALGMRTVAVYSDADAESQHRSVADEAVHIGPAAPAESYLNASRIIDAARETRAEAIHPGYGFLSENAEFAQAVIDAGLVWIGPSPDVITAMGDKARAREQFAALGFPVNRGRSEPIADESSLGTIASEIGFPIILKAAAGGGGIGMRVVSDPNSLSAAYASAREQAARTFGDPTVILERYLPSARHVEIQILGLADGTVAVLGERECSVQRRFQKVIEESPSPGVSPELRARMFEAAERAATAMGYSNAGTIECLVAGEEFVFLEVNTRLQVEHPVTELVTGLDLVAEQFQVAAGQPSNVATRPPTHGHAIELRVYAEDPRRFFPSPGTITRWDQPAGPGIRVDSGYRMGDVVSQHYDPLLAKLVVWGTDRQEAIARARDAVASFRIEGVKTNLSFLDEVLAHQPFVSGQYDTQIVSRLRA